jgi:hypothetical protein
VLARINDHNIRKLDQLLPLKLEERPRHARGVTLQPFAPLRAHAHAAAFAGWIGSRPGSWSSSGIGRVPFGRRPDGRRKASGHSQVRRQGS